MNKAYVAAQLTLQAQSLKDRDPAALELSALLAMESLNLAPSVDADHIVRVAIALLRKPFKNIPHGKLISAIAFSSDGKWLATASDDNQLHIEAVNSGEKLAPRSHTGTISHIVFSPDHSLLATASAKTIRIFDTTNPDFLRLLTLKGSILSIVFRRNHRLAIGSNDGLAQVIDASSGAPIVRFPVIEGLRFVTLDLKGKMLAAAAGNSLHLFDVEAKRKVSFSPLKHARFVRMAAFSPDSSLIGTASDDGVVKIFNTRTGVLVTTIFPSHLPAYNIVFSNDNRLVATASADNFVRVFRVGPKCKEVSWLKHGGPITYIGFASNGELVITGSEDHTARVFETDSGNEIARMTHPAPVTAVALDERSGTIATASAGLARLYNDFVSAPGSVSLGRTVAITHAAFNASKKVVVASDAKAASDAKVLVLSSAGELLREVPTLGVPVTHIAFSNDGKSIAMRFVTGITKLEHEGVMRTIGSNSRQERRSGAGLAFSGDNARLSIAGDSTDLPDQDQAIVRTFNTADGMEVGPPKFCAGQALAVALSHNHEIVAIGTTERVCIFLQEQVYGPVADRGVSAIAFDSTNSLIAIGTRNGSLEVFDLKGNRIFASDEYEGAATDIFFIDENTVATLTVRGVARVFNIHDGKMLLRLPNTITAFGLLGKRLLVLSQDHTGFILQVHNVAPKDLIQQGCSIVSGSLFEREWADLCGPLH
jgi:WD40 repeat protein